MGRSEEGGLLQGVGVAGLLLASAGLWGGGVVLLGSVNVLAFDTAVGKNQENLLPGADTESGRVT